MQFDEMAIYNVFYQKDGVYYRVEVGKVREEISQEEYERLTKKDSSDDNMAHLLYTENQIRQLVEEWEAEPKRIHPRQLPLLHELTILSDQEFITYLKKYGAA